MGHVQLVVREKDGKAVITQSSLLHTGKRVSQDAQTTFRTPVARKLEHFQSKSRALTGSLASRILFRAELPESNRLSCRGYLPGNLVMKL